MGRPINVKTGRTEEELRRRSREHATRVVRLRQSSGRSPVPGEERIPPWAPYWKRVWIDAYTRHWRASHGLNPRVGP